MIRIAAVLALALSVLPAIVRAQTQPAGRSEAPSAAGDPSRFPVPAVFTSATPWDDPSFVDLWLPTASPSQIAHKTFPEKPLLFGHQPHMVTGLFRGGRLVSISILFLDSGTFFGYVPDGGNAPNARERQEQFDVLFEKIRADVTAGLGELDGQRQGEALDLGEEPMLRQKCLLFEHGDVASRLLAVEGQLIKLILFRSREDAGRLFDPALGEWNSRELADHFRSRARANGDGDHFLEDIPLFPQGNRAYCGVSTLAMAMQFVGLNLETEEYAAAAGIRYGTAKGAEVREVYQAAAQELGMRFSRTTRFDFNKTMESIDTGLPVIVWRRFTFERDYVHSTFARRYAQDKRAVLPEADDGDRSTWPGNGAYNHSSVITGYNRERGEVIFTESWNEHARNRRMRFEEMEGTAYYTFFLRF